MPVCRAPASCVTSISASLRNLSQCSSASAPVTISNSGLMAGRGSAPEQLYTVPEAVLFRSFELLGAQQQTRSLLLQNKTGKPVAASVSLPFTAHFRIAASGIATSDGAPAQNHATPPHMVVVVQPGVPCKVRRPKHRCLLLLAAWDMGSKVPKFHGSQLFLSGATWAVKHIH